MAQWDSVIVGGGSAGAVLASRLSEDPDRHVLLLEAGPDYRSAEAPPEMRTGHWTSILDLERFPQYQWPALEARRRPDRPPEPYWRGRGAGGSSSINGQVAVRPPLDDFAEWVAAGGPLWEPERVLQSFIRLEDDLSYGPSAIHGAGGPVPISRADLEAWGQLDLAFRSALVHAGHRWTPDCNDPSATGCSIFAFNARDGVRVSTNDGYLEPARSRPNLEIRGEHLVDRVCFNGDRATGVIALVDGQPRRFEADHIVVSAGAIHSPAILMRSGIGPPDHLRALGVAVVAPLAVGVGFQEHPHTYFGFPIHDSVLPPVNGRHTNTCVRWTSGEVDGDNDMMGLVNGPAPALPGYAGIGLFVNRPYSRGTVSLASTDPTEDPLVDMHLAEDRRDLVRLRQCVAMTRDLLDSEAFRTVIAGAAKGADGTRLSELGDPAAADAWIARTVDGSAHASCTCPMGDPDGGGVVDGRGRVHGTTGLCVADMSIAPSVPRANTNLTAIMIGEHLAAEW